MSKKLENIRIAKEELNENGFAILDRQFSDSEINQILACITREQNNDTSVLRTKDLFAIRHLFKNIPDLADLIFNDNLKSLLSEITESLCFLTKAIYFDKPSESNWFVAYHQDLSISVDQKADLEKYSNWTFKKGQFGVQPPIKILQDTITIRIHLDQTNKNNGALRVIPKSHMRGVIRTDLNGLNYENEQICEVEKGGIMLMKPLTLHASNRTTNARRRRVIHLEFNKHELSKPLSWLERLEVP